LTFLVGPNSSGKTTIASALMLLAQSGMLSLLNTTPVWSGGLIDLGSYKDAVFKHNEKRHIILAVTVKNVPGAPPEGVRLTYTFKRSADPIGLLSELELCDLSNEFQVSIKRKRGPKPAYAIYIGGIKKVWATWRPPLGIYYSDTLPLILAKCIEMFMR